jgi:HD-GYP domain-containing protein (c-di-GMP phosphodiesterase class II)
MNSHRSDPPDREASLPASTRLARIPRDLLCVGYCLPGDLFDRDGKLLLRAGARLTDADVRIIDAQRVRGLYGAEGWPEHCLLGLTSAVVDGPPDCTVPAGRLRPGLRLTHDIRDNDGHLLLAAGAQITQPFLEQLETRGITDVQLAPAAKPAVKLAAVPYDTSGLDRALAKAVQHPRPIRDRSTADRPRLPLQDLHEKARHGIERHTAARMLAAEICDQIESGRPVSAAQLDTTIREFIDLIHLDHDLAPLIVAMQSSPDEYLFDHCVNVALVSMTIAAQVGWSTDTIAELGTGAFLHDVGMLRVPASIRLAPRPLTENEWQLVRRHPLHTLAYLDRIRGLTRVAALIAYQVHERCDGSGYPNRHACASLHPYARIVSIADTYSAMIRKRPYRDAHVPYSAIKTLLFGAGAGKYDRTFVRVLLDTLAIFPVGSLVDLSDGSTGRVIRANPGLHTRPVVEILDRRLQDTGSTIDLAVMDDIGVVGAGARLRPERPPGPG